ncbi:MAG: hypothetical protein IJ180_00460 [Bacteroidales bacterium]|nr:hypothetical protein [Bacteroidales bacterium]
MSLHSEFTLDNSQLLQKLKQSQEEINKAIGNIDRRYEESSKGFSTKIRQIQSQVDASGRIFENVAGKVGMLTNALQAFIGIQVANGISGFISKMINVRAEFQNIEASMEVFLGSADKAKSFLDDLQSYAFNNVFEFEDLAKASESLLGFGTSAEETIDVIDKLSNIASGLHVPLQELVDLYNKAKSSPKLMTEDIAQWERKGLPVIKQLAEEMGGGIKKEQELRANISKGVIKFEDLEKVINRVNAEGGMFAGMMQKKMDTLGDSIGLLEDNITNMFNELGQMAEGPLKFGIDLAGKAVEHYQEILRIIGLLVTALGSYKATLITINALHKVSVAVDRLQVALRYIRMYRAELGLATAAQRAFNLSMLSNPATAIAFAITGLATAVYLYTTRTKEATEQTLALQRVEEKVNEEYDEQASKIDRLDKIVHDNNVSLTERQKALNELKVICTEYNAEITKEGKIINDNTDKLKEYLVQLHKEIKLKAIKDDLEKADVEQRKLKKQQDSEEDELQEAKSKLAWAKTNVTTQAQQKLGTSGMRTIATGANAEIQSLQTTVSQIEERLKKTRKEKEKIDKEIASLEKEYEEAGKEETAKTKNNDDNVNNGNKGDKDAKKKLKELQQAKKDFDNFLTSFSQKGRDAEISLISDETERKISEEIEWFIRENDKLDKELSDLKEKAKEAKESIPDNIDEVYKTRQEALEKELYDKVEKIQKEADDKYEKELLGLLDSYADYNEKRLAIDKKYNEDLEKLQELRKQAEEKGNENDVKRIDSTVKTLKVNKTKEVVELDFQQLKETPEYTRAFEDLEQTSTETIRYLIQEFDKVKQAAAESLDPKDLQEYIDVLEKLQNELDSRDTFAAITNARLELKIATEELTEAEKEHSAAEKNFGKGSVQEITANKKIASAKDKQTKATKKLVNAETTLLNSIKDLASGFKELGDTIGGDFGSAISAIGDMGVTILSTIMQLKALEVQARNTEIAIRSLETATVILAAISAAFTVLTTLYQTFFNKEDDSYERAKGAMEGYIEVLDKVIDKEKELMNFYAGQAGEMAYEKARASIEKEQEFLKKSFNDYLNSGAGMFSSSKGVQMSKDIKNSGKYGQIIESVMMALSGADGSNWSYIAVQKLLDGRMTDLVNLTAEQLEALKMSDVWGYLDSETKDYINSLIECDEKLEDLRQQRIEWLTGLSESDWHNEFLDGLLDIEATAEDVFNNIAEYIRKAMIQHLVFSKMQDELSYFYNKYTDYMENAENMTMEERQEWLEDFKERLQTLITEGKEDAAKINSLFSDIVDSTRSASNNAFAQMTQDQATKLEGMFTAVQGHTYDIRDYTHEMRDCAVIIQREISGIHVDTSAIVRLLGGVENRMAVVDSRLKGFEMRGVKMS